MNCKSGHVDGQEVLWKQPAVHCIFHVTGIQHGNFTPLSNVKGSAIDKLFQLRNIRDR